MRKPSRSRKAAAARVSPPREAAAPSPVTPAPSPVVPAPAAAGEEAVRQPPQAGRRIHALAASALFLVYLAVMNGHLSSMDGFLMYRQARALALEHSIRFQTPGRFWTGEAVWNSKFGIGLSLLYVPGMMLASPLASLVPATEGRPAKPAEFYFRQLYEDPLYAVGGAWVHAAVVAFCAFLVARLMTALGCSRRAALWGMALYGIGSSAFVYARGDFSQPLEALCWTGALFAAVRFRQSASSRALWACAAAVGYAILVRPFEGMLLLPAVLALVLPQSLSRFGFRALQPGLAVVSGALAALVVTALVNQARSGSALEFGYKLENVWTLPDAARLATLLVGPARGILWEFPAIVLVPLGAAVLLGRARRREVQAMLLLCAALLLHTAVWKVWWGGWCWGLRLFLPAMPLLAVVAGAGIDGLAPRTRRWLPALLLLAGLVWALPGVTTDILGGFAQMTDAAPAAWTIRAWPPFGAWQFLERPFATDSLDRDVVDIVWLRLAHATGYWSLVVPVVLVLLALVLLARSRRELLAEERKDSLPS